MKKYKIVYGVCGIGNGHSYRQLPIIEYLSKNSTIVIYAYDSSYRFYSQLYKDSVDIHVLEVAVPFYVGSKNGIDFEATKNLEINKKDFDKINNDVHTRTEEIIGTPDLVISDYEPESAKYAYKHHAPFITIDQQSKYLLGDFPSELHGMTYADEIARLKMFFPSAYARIACSFFNVKQNKISGDDVIITAPIIKSSIVNLKRVANDKVSIVVYLSTNMNTKQSVSDLINVCKHFEDIEFNFFISKSELAQESANIKIFNHDTETFEAKLKECRGIISTAGHTLLSEAMFLGIPVFAIPLKVYEQEMNAKVISDNRFGLSSEVVDVSNLKYFIDNLEAYKDNIIKDNNILKKGNGYEEIIKCIESYLE